MCITFILRISINIGLSCESCCVWMVNTCRYKAKNALIHRLIPLKVSYSGHQLTIPKIHCADAAVRCCCRRRTASALACETHFGSCSFLYQHNANCFFVVVVVVYRQMRTVKTNANRFIDCYLTNDCAWVCVFIIAFEILKVAYVYCCFAPTKMPKWIERGNEKQNHEFIVARNGLL